jgi:hypothetical protein
VLWLLILLTALALLAAFLTLPRRERRHPDFLTSHQVERLGGYSREHRVDRWQAMLELGLVGSRERAMERAREQGLGFVDLDRVHPSPDALASIAPDTARELNVIPLKRDGNQLWLAMRDIESVSVIEVQELTGCRVHPVVVDPIRWDEALERFYPLQR